MQFVRNLEQKIGAEKTRKILKKADLIKFWNSETAGELVQLNGRLN